MCFGLSFFEVPENGLPSASVSFSKLGCGLFACAVCLPYFLRIKSAAGVAFIALTSVSATVLFDLF